jgi:hypothetical protein
MQIMGWKGVRVCRSVHSVDGWRPQSTAMAEKHHRNRAAHGSKRLSRQNDPAGPPWHGDASLAVLEATAYFRVRLCYKRADLTE